MCADVNLMTELERISAIEAHSETRPLPKHDVLAVLGYIKAKIPHNPLDKLLLVERQKDTTHHVRALDTWISSQSYVSKYDTLKREGEDKLKKIWEELKAEERDFESLARTANPNTLQNDMEITVEEASNGSGQGVFQLERERLFMGALLTAPQPAVSSTPAVRKKSMTAIAADTAPSSPFVLNDLSLPFYLSELARRLASLLEHSFHSVTNQAHVRQATRITTWQPPDRQEDDSMTALGLARDPTKITSRIIQDQKAAGKNDSVHWIACESPPGVLHNGSSSACKSFFVESRTISDLSITVWLISVDGDNRVRAMAFSLTLESQARFEILDIEFFDDVEVAILLKLPSEGSRSKSL